MLYKVPRQAARSSRSFADAGTDCLQKSGFKEEKCQQQVNGLIAPSCTAVDRVFQVDALYECCNAFYQRNGDNASCVSCPKASLLRYCVQSDYEKATADASKAEDETAQRSQVDRESITRDVAP